MGGRYQITQAYLSVIDPSLPPGPVAEAVFTFSDGVLGVGRGVVVFSLPPSSFLSPGSAGVCPDDFTQSNALPGVLGVFDEPKEAKAPDPRPKALDAPVVGDETVFVFRGEMALKGLPRPEEVPSPAPSLLAAE